MSTLDVDKLIPEPAKEDLKEVVALLGLAKDNVIDLVKESQKIRFDGSGATNLAGAIKQTDDYNRKRQELTTSMQEYIKMMEAVQTTEARYAVMQSDEGKMLVENRDKLRQQTQELRAQGDAYKELVLKYQAAAAEALRLGAANGTTNQQYKAQAAYARSLSQELLSLEQSVGRNFRQVGNYNMVNHELSQVLREMPSFAYSASTGFLSLSNNIPMLLDRIKQLRSEGQSMTEIIKGLGLSLVSPINLITVAIAALTIFSARMSESKNSTKEATNQLEEYRNALKKFHDEQERKIESNLDENDAGVNAAKRARDLAKAKIDGTKASIDAANTAEDDYYRKQRAKLERERDWYQKQAKNTFQLPTYDPITGEETKSKFEPENPYQVEANKRIEAIKDLDTQREIDQANNAKRAKKDVDLTNEILAAEKRKNDAESALRKLNLEEDATHQKNISENTINSLDERLNAWNEYIEDKRVINGIDAQRDLKDIQDKLSKISEIEQISDSKRTGEQKKLLVEKDALLAEQSLITAKYAKNDADITEEQEKGKTNIIKQEMAERKFTMEAYFRAVGKGLEDAYKGQEEYARKELDLAKQLTQAKLNLKKEEVNGLEQLGNIVLDKEMKNLDDRQTALNADKDHQLALIDAMNVSDQRRADLKKALEEDTYAKEQDIAKERKRIEREKFYLQQSSALANVAINAQEAVAKIEAEAAVLSSNPVTASLAPLAYAQIPVVIAGAAISAGIIGAQIIAYGEGTDYHPYDSLAILGDKYEPELVQEPGKDPYWSGSSPELHFLPQGTSVTPLSKMDSFMLAQLYPIKEHKANDSQAMVNELKALRKEIAEKPVSSFSIDGGSIRHSIKRGNTTTNFIKRNIVD